MKRILLTVSLAGIALFVGAVSGLATLWLVVGGALAGGFGWMLGGLPSGPSTADNTGAGGADGGGDGGGGGE